MTTRLGIELSPAACRIVEVEAGLAWHRHVSDTRVRSFAVLPLSGPETRAKLQSLRRRRAAVVVWNAPSEHRQVVVNGGSYESMRAEALGALAEVGLRTRGVWADIAPASHPANRSARQPVVVALAAAAEMSAALQPIIDAGIRVRTVTMPAMALAPLARLRRRFSVPDAIEAYVALEEEVTWIALVRGSVLIAAHELAWGYIDERPSSQEAALPFDAELGTILFSPDRKLAIDDSGIVAIGDEVRGAHIHRNHAKRRGVEGWARSPQEARIRRRSPLDVHIIATRYLLTTTYGVYR